MADAFLSYSRADEAAVSRVRARLTEAGLSTFFDRLQLAAGQPWQEVLEREITASKAVVVFVGRGGFSSWQHREIQLANSRQARAPGFAVIPVLLPGVEDPPTGSFLLLNTWVDLRGDESDAAQFHRLVAGIQGQPPEGDSAQLRASICPYRGLHAFREEDAGLYFGREEDAARLLALTLERPLVAVVGRSGSGKSSLVYAGLLPALRRRPDGRDWDVVSIRPGSEPLHALVRAFAPPPEAMSPIEQRARINHDVARFRDGTVSLDEIVRDRLAGQPGTGRLLLHIDQWEELYTQARAGVEDRERRAKDAVKFIDLVLATTKAGHLTVVLTLRADWFDSVLEHRDLSAAVRGSMLPLGPMSRAELQSCIEKPAQAVGLVVDPQVVSDMLIEVGGDVGKLPLLEYALEGTWRHRDPKTGRLTLEAYAKAGRINGAIGERAERVFSALTESERSAACRLFVNLVSIGEGQEDTRASAPIPKDPEALAVIDRFSASGARLLVTGSDAPDGHRVVEVTHEALIRGWPTFRKWVDESREILRTRDRMRAQWKHWEANGRDGSLLLQPGRALEEGRQLLAKHGDVKLAPELVAYVERSVEHAETAKREAERSRLRRMQLLGGGALVCLVLAGLAVWQWVAVRHAEERATANGQRLADQSAFGRVLLAVEELFPTGPKAIDEATATVRDAEAALGRLEQDRAAHDRLAGLPWRSPEDEGSMRLLSDVLRDGARVQKGALATLVRRFEVSAPWDDDASWAKTIAGIADRDKNPIYGGWTLPKKQFGLYPLGQDPQSHLFEFAHVYSGSCPSRDDKGRLVFSASGNAAIVFVLIPGGTFWMGAQEQAEHNADPNASGDEGPEHSVPLSPYFLAKHECTQAQWERLTGETPAYFEPKEGVEQTKRNPVEQVSWEGCVGKPGWLSQFGLTLPTEAQWEYACRAPFDDAGKPLEKCDPWSIARAEDGTLHLVRDAQSRRDAAHYGANSEHTWPVGRKWPNRFGMHDMHGNVWEWCWDRYDGGFYKSPDASRKDPMGPDTGSGDRVTRGGSWKVSADIARSSFRVGSVPWGPGHDLGVRPARPVTSD